MLSIAVTGDEPPSEFRIFAAGKVETTKGTFTFDAASAKSVMAEYARHGIDLMIDYDHASLAGVSLDPAQSGKAAGWFNLAVRDGELWAVNVRWTEPAADALRRKEWRFMSPAFGTDADGRITDVLNVAITNLPATRKLDPLMAASITALSGDQGMDPKLIAQALDALAAGDAEKCMELLKSIIASAAGGDTDAPADGATPPGADVGAGDATEMTSDDPPAPPKDEKKEEVAAAISRLSRITGKGTIFDAVNEVEVWRASHIKLEDEKAKLAKEREALELGKRKENAAMLVKLGAETPHTSGLAKGKLAKRLLDEPLEEQTKRVAELLAAKGGKVPTAPKHPSTGSGANPAEDVVDANGLTARDLQICKDMGCDPKTFAMLKARRDGASTTTP